MQYRRLCLAAGILVVVALASSFASRSALGVVVDSCKLNLAVTGSAFPCLKVVQEQKLLESYAILREPTHRERTILTPLAEISGIEDPRLLAADGPNYFDYAWNERSVVLNGAPRKDPWQDAALAINPAWNRTQDHLHVHIGCVSVPLQSALKAHLADISAIEFKRISTRLHWRNFWVRLIKADSLSAVNPFQLVAEGVPGARGNMENVTIGVVGTVLKTGERGFYILAEVYPTDESYGSAEDLLDAKCR